MTRSERIVRFLLRMMGTVMCLAVFAVFMPRGWMDFCHRRIGLGPLPQGPIVEYLARSASALYAVMGGLAWVLSSDVRRYARIIACQMVFALAFSLIIIGIDLRVGMPWYWTISEGPTLTVFSVVVLALQRRAGREAAGTGNQ